jgi:AcrR family transcriptional regulator
LTSTIAAKLRPRKSPVQARSAATVEALHMATIQVLMREGLSRCTTTYIAQRAGTSVGSLYQYYPNRDALLVAVLEMHLDEIAGSVNRSCQEQRGKPVSDMASALVTTFLAAKLRDPDKSRVLYAVAGERGGAKLAARVHARMATAITAMLASAPDAHFDDPAVTAAILLGTLLGQVRILLEGQAPPGFHACLEGQLILALTAYLQAHRR